MCHPKIKEKDLWVVEIKKMQVRVSREKNVKKKRVFF